MINVVFNYWNTITTILARSMALALVFKKKDVKEIIANINIALALIHILVLVLVFILVYVCRACIHITCTYMNRDESSSEFLCKFTDTNTFTLIRIHVHK